MIFITIYVVRIFLLTVINTPILIISIITNSIIVFRRFDNFSTTNAFLISNFAII